MMRRPLSTTELAKKLKFSQAYLQKLVARKLVPSPKLIEVGNLKIRLWSDADVKRLRAALAKRPRSERKKPKRRKGASR